VFGVPYSSAQRLFTCRAGTTPEQGIASIDGFIAGEIEDDREPNRYERQQAIIDQMLATALTAERQVHKVVVVLASMFGL